jgi:molybdopterin-guanine dinucleotide biosynthesis adapter protein
MFKAVSVVGFKKSGKTSLVLELGQGIGRRGRKVAAVKFTHHALDLDGRTRPDSRRSASAWPASAPKLTTLLWNSARQLQDIFPCWARISSWSKAASP